MICWCNAPNLRRDACLKCPRFQTQMSGTWQEKIIKEVKGE